jgi:hypothetical protein
MKSYSVVYLSEAEEELISLWENALDRTKVADAANTADQVLATSPQSRSVYLGEELWRLDIEPLRFYFTVRDGDRIVEVSNVIEFSN